MSKTVTPEGIVSETPKYTDRIGKLIEFAEKRDVSITRYGSTYSEWKVEYKKASGVKVTFEHKNLETALAVALDIQLP